MGQMIVINGQADVISRRTLERLLRLQREHDGLVRAVRTRLARGATIEECGLHFEVSSGRLLVSTALQDRLRRDFPRADLALD